jgi:hypothetical protein
MTTRAADTICMAASAAADAVESAVSSAVAALEHKQGQQEQADDRVAAAGEESQLSLSCS